MGKIYLDKLGDKAYLCKRFGVSYPTVRRALRDQSRNNLASQIRYVAKKELKGVEVR